MSQLPQTRTRGYTLIELMIAVVVLALVVIGVGQLFMGVSDFYAFAIQRNEVLERTRRIFDELDAELMQARVISVETGDTDWPSIVYVLPIDVGEDGNGNGVLDAGEDENGNGVLDLVDGDVTDPAGNIQWGCIEDDGPRLDLPGDEHRVTLTFVRDRIVREPTEGFDLNGDGDEVDLYPAGSLVRTTTDGSTRRYGGGYVLLAWAPGPRRDGDRDGDGVGDPLVSTLGEPFTDVNDDGIWNVGETFTDSNSNGTWDGFTRVHVTMYRADVSGNPHLVHAVRQITPRNEQQ